MPQTLGSVAIVKGQGSPNWHRRLRARRSVTRLAIRQGKPVRKDRLVALAHHHGTCQTRRRHLEPMGKAGRQDKWKSQKAWYPESQQHASWSVWPGAWAQSPQARRAAAERTPQFPAYDSVSKDNTGMIVVSEHRYEKPQLREGPQLVNVVQAAVNHARKLNNRVEKLQREIGVKNEQWKAYMAGMKQALQQEKRRHSTAVGKLTMEIQEVQQQVDYANEQLRRAAAAGLLQQAPRDGDGDQEWDAMMLDVEQKGPDFLQDLERMLQGAGGTVRPMQAGSAPATPPHKPRPAEMLTPPSVAPTPPQSTTAAPLANFGAPPGPYVGSPGQQARTSTETGSKEAVDVPMEPSPKSRPKPEQRPRTPVKKLPQAIPHADAGATTLADKLGERRQSLIAKMEASGQHHGPEPAPPSGGGPQTIDLESGSDFEELSRELE